MTYNVFGGTLHPTLPISTYEYLSHQQERNVRNKNIIQYSIS